MFNRIIDYKVKNDGTVVGNYPIIGDDMTMEIQCFIDDVRAHKTYFIVWKIQKGY